MGTISKVLQDKVARLEQTTFCLDMPVAAIGTPVEFDGLVFTMRDTQWIGKDGNHLEGSSYPSTTALGIDEIMGYSTVESDTLYILRQLEEKQSRTLGDIVEHTANQAWSDERALVALSLAEQKGYILTEGDKLEISEKGLSALERKSV